MECIYSRALQNPNVSAVLVENPAPGFSQLRDAVLLTLCVDSGLISTQLLLPGWQRSKQHTVEPPQCSKAPPPVANIGSIKSLDALNQGVQSLQHGARELLLNFTKETPTQITR